MTRKRRTRVLILDPILRKSLAGEVRIGSAIEEISAPNIALIQATVRESARRSLFHLGEVLVTQAKVRVEGVLGWGLIQGRDFEAAMELAVIDAAWNANLALTRSWEAKALAAEVGIEAGLDREQAELAATRVEFETLDQGNLP